MTWMPADFLVACGREPTLRAGYVYRGLGLVLSVRGSPKGRRKPIWALTHLGSGHALCLIEGDVKTAFPIASEIAELGDWDWDGFEGYKNRDPELLTRASDVIERLRLRRFGGLRSEGVAQAISIARAGGTAK